ncbi:uncharacterized protein LOC100575965 [Acyrthosiphon pisum]|uniref:Uncharacterized protein n=1 Tax=Acyrthosiphon pisum TaxID=7029 RepID=A0A8R2NRP4_ACYPI|nr:uncharacterized protein LOC100575965 [Acyrthosiphon pisum]
MDRQSAADANRTNQCNKDHSKTGPGRPHGYQGKGDKADLDNRAQQKDPNYKGSGNTK